jgi:hypothetical protein
MSIAFRHFTPTSLKRWPVRWAAIGRRRSPRLRPLALRHERQKDITANQQPRELVRALHFGDHHEISKPLSSSTWRLSDLSGVIGRCSGRHRQRFTGSHRQFDHGASGEYSQAPRDGSSPNPCEAHAHGCGSIRQRSRRGISQRAEELRRRAADTTGRLPGRCNCAIWSFITRPTVEKTVRAVSPQSTETPSDRTARVVRCSLAALLTPRPLIR